MPITRKDIEKIFHTRKSLLYNDIEPWVKKEVGTVNDIVKAYDGTKFYKFIGIYVLYSIGKSTIQKIFSYLQMTNWTRKNKKKQLHSLFKKKDCNLKVVNYIDITFNVSDGFY